MSMVPYHQPEVPLEHDYLLLQTLTGHKSYVSSVVIPRNQSTQILSASYDDTAKLWELKTGKCLKTFRGHTDGLTFVTSGPQGRVMTASEDRSVRMWDPHTTECVQVLRGHNGSVTSAAIVGDRIVTGSVDRKLRVFYPDGRLCSEVDVDNEVMALAVATVPLPLAPDTATEGGRLKATTGKTTPKNRSRNLANVSSSPAPAAHPRLFAAGGVHIPAPAKPLLLCVESIGTETEFSVGDDVNCRRTSWCTEHGDAKEMGAVMSVALATPGGGTLVTGSYDGYVRVFFNALPPRKPPRHRPVAGAAEALVLGRHKEGVRAVAVSEDGRWVVSGCRGGIINIWETPGALTDSSTPRAASKIGHGAGGGNGVGGATGNGVFIGGSPAATITAHHGVIFSLSISSDLRLLASAGSDRGVRVWDLSRVVYAKRIAVNRARVLWSEGRIRQARPRRAPSTAGTGGVSALVLSKCSLPNEGGLGGQGAPSLVSAREQRQQRFERLFALPDIVYTKILKYV